MKIYILQFHTYSSYSYDGTVEGERVFFLTRERLDQYVKDNKVCLDENKSINGGWATIEEDEMIE